MENKSEIPPNTVFDVEPQYIISLTKFIVLSIFSCGLYPVWWSYKAWRFFHQKDKFKVNPALLTGILFLYPLFKNIAYFAHTKGFKADYLALLLSLGYTASVFFMNFVEELWFLAFFNFLFFIPAFLALNQAKLSSTEFVVIKKRNFSVGQIFILVFGSLYIIQIIILLFEYFTTS